MNDAREEETREEETREEETREEETREERQDEGRKKRRLVCKKIQKGRILLLNFPPRKQQKNKEQKPTNKSIQMINIQQKQKIKIKYTIYNIQYTIYNIQYTIYNIQ